MRTNFPTTRGDPPAVMNRDETLAIPGPAEAPGAADVPAGEGGKERAKPRPRQRRLRWMLAIASLLIAAAVAGTVQHFRYLAVHPYTDDASVKGDLVLISSKLSGRVSRVLVEDQRQVRRGQLLAEIDPIDAQINVQQAVAALQVARARVQQARAALIAQEHQAAGSLAQAQAGARAAAARVPQAQTGLTLQRQQSEAELVQAEAAVEAARAALDLAQRNLAAQEQLFRQGAVSQAQLDSARAQYDSAAAQYRQAQARLALATANQAQVRVREQEVVAAEAQQAQAVAGVTTAVGARDLIQMRRADLAAAQATVAQAEAQLAAAREELQNTRITAPADGVVSQLAVQAGQLIQSGQPLLALVRSSERWVVAYFKETEVGRMRPGQPALVRVDALGRDFHGTVVSVGAATGSTFSLLPPENASGNFVKVVQRVPVRIALEDASDQELQVGLSCEVTVDTAGHAR